MKRLTIAMAFAFAALPGMLQAQSAPEPVTSAQTAVETRTLRDQLMPTGAATAVTAPATATEADAFQPNQPVMQRRGSGVAMMIAGAGLFIGGLLIGGDAGTAVAVAGAAIGAYGLYIHFQ